MSREYFEALKKYSKNQPYIQGRNFEYRCMRALRKLGYYVVRKFGSKGHEDLVAFKNDTVLMVQCKWSKKRNTEPRSYDLAGLVDLAKKYGAFAIFAGVRNHRIHFRVYENGMWLNAKLD